MITVNFSGQDAYIVAQSYLSSLQTFKRDQTITDYQEFRYLGTTWSGYDVEVNVYNYQSVQTIN